MWRGPRIGAAVYSTYVLVGSFLYKARIINGVSLESELHHSINRSPVNGRPSYELRLHVFDSVSWSRSRQPNSMAANTASGSFPPQTGRQPSSFRAWRCPDAHAESCHFDCNHVSCLSAATCAKHPETAVMYVHSMAWLRTSNASARQILKPPTGRSPNIKPKRLPPAMPP